MTSVKKIVFSSMLLLSFQTFCEFTEKNWSFSSFLKSIFRSYDEEETSERINYTPFSKLLFNAYLNQKNYSDRDEIEQILKKCKKSRLYHLDRAFRHGIRKLGKYLFIQKRIKIEGTVWRISQDFAKENMAPKLHDKVMKYSAVVAIFLAGSYFGQHYRIWNDFCSIFCCCQRGND